MAIAAAAVAGLLGLGVAAWWQAAPQNPPGPWRPVNAVREGREPHLLLAGHDVVAYFTRGLPQPGSPRFTSLHQGVRLRFDNAGHQALFEQDPQRYLPQFGGLCAQAMAHARVRVADPRLWRIHEGRLYLFQDSSALQAFEVDRAFSLRQAHAYWDSEVRGTHSLLQFLKGLVQ